MCGTSVVERMLAQHRYAWLLRPQIAADLDDEELAQALAAFREGMALVPGGEVVLQTWMNEVLEFLASQPSGGRRVAIEPAYIDRHTVTNQQFEQFVREGCYGNRGLWSPEAWERVSEFVDRSGEPGPRGWRKGRFPPEKADHPVVGVSWFEADAYSRWVGKRLPTDAEWVKAACWPLHVEGDELAHRRYPWGDVMDRTKANVWSSRVGGTVPVTDFAAGVSGGGLHQLTGNVWEWTAGTTPLVAVEGRVKLPWALKSLRGGAFDTYLDDQATCQFQSGDCPFARRRNVGFRNAVSACDVIDPCLDLVGEARETAWHDEPTEEAWA